MDRTKAPYLHIRAGDTLHVEGTIHCLLGNPLRHADGPPAGIFAEWHWDGNEVLVRNDRYGMQPLFYFARPGELCLAPSLLMLLERGAPRDLDWPALAVFFRLGFFLGEDTPFSAIKTVPPNARFRWDRAGLEVQGNPPVSQSNTTINRDQAIQTYQELFTEAVERCLPDAPFASLLSGGRDSRHILFELCRQGRKPDLVATVSRGNNTDVSVSERIAREFGLKYLRVAAPPLSLEGEIARNQETHFCADEHGWIFALRDALEGRVSILYDGLAGDVLSAGLFLDPQSLELMRARKFDDLARKLAAEVGPFVERLLSNEAGRFGEESATTRIASELELHADAPNPIGSFYFWNRTRREIALSPFSIFQKFRVHVPFLDDKLFDFLTSLPAEHFLDHTFHDQTIALAYPQWSHIPYSTEAQVPISFHDMRFAWQMLRWFCHHRSADMNLRYLLPRLARAGLDPFYCRRAIDNLTILPIYWTLLEEESRAESRETRARRVKS